MSIAGSAQIAPRRLSRFMHTSQRIASREALLTFVQLSPDHVSVKGRARSLRFIESSHLAFTRWGRPRVESDRAARIPCLRRNVGGALHEPYSAQARTAISFNGLPARHGSADSDPANAI